MEPPLSDLEQTEELPQTELPEQTKELPLTQELPQIEEPSQIEEVIKVIDPEIIHDVQAAIAPVARVDLKGLPRSQARVLPPRAPARPKPILSNPSKVGPPTQEQITVPIHNNPKLPTPSHRLSSELRRPPLKSYNVPSTQTEQVHEFDLLVYLTEQGLEFIDKRPKGGALWVVGDSKLAALMHDLESRGYRFQFLENGGHATKNRPAWFCRKI